MSEAFYGKFMMTLSLVIVFISITDLLLTSTSLWLLGILTGILAFGFGLTFHFMEKRMK